MAELSEGHETTVDPADVAAFTDLLYAWLADNLVDAEVIEGDGSPGHPVRMRARWDPANPDRKTYPVEVTFGRV